MNGKLARVLERLILLNIGGQYQAEPLITSGLRRLGATKIPLITEKTRKITPHLRSERRIFTFINAIAHFARIVTEPLVPADYDLL